MVYLKPKNKEIERLMERLMKYPLQTVDGKLAQSFSRHKSIRFLNQNRHDPKIIIQRGVVGLKPNVKIKKTKKGYRFDIF